MSGFSRLPDTNPTDRQNREAPIQHLAQVLLASGEPAVSAEHRKPIVAFVLLAFAAATLVGIQSADAQGGRLMAAVIGGTARVHGSLPLPAYEPPSETVADLGPVFEALHSAPAPKTPTTSGEQARRGSSAATVQVQRAVATSVPSNAGTARTAASTGSTDRRSQTAGRVQPTPSQRAAERAEKTAARARAEAERASAKADRAVHRAQRAAAKAAERNAKAAARVRRGAERAVERASSSAEKTLRDLGRTIGSFSRDRSYGRASWPARSESKRSRRDRRGDDHGRHEKRAAHGSSYTWGDLSQRSERWTGRDRSDHDRGSWHDRDRGNRSWRDRDRGNRSWGDRDRDGRSWGDRDGSRHGWRH